MITHDDKLKLLTLLFKPLARFCIRQSIFIQDVILALRKSFVEAAEEELSLITKKINSSRISVITGVHRDDVTKLRRKGQIQTDNTPVIVRVIGLWEQSKRFCNKNGQPRALSCQGDNSEFAQLVAKVTKNLNPGTLLFELERNGLIKKTNKGVKLVKRGVSTQGDSEKVIKLVSQELDSLLAAVTENVKSVNETKNAHIRTEYDNIYLSNVPHIRAWMIEKVKLLHREAREFLAMHDKDINPREDELAGVKVSLSAFSYIQIQTDPTLSLDNLKQNED